MSFQDFVDKKESDQKIDISNKKLIIAALIAAALIGAAFLIFTSNDSAQTEFSVQKGEMEIDNAALDDPVDAINAVEDAEPEQICVHIGGCVLNPGICYLRQGSRIADAVEAAGGMSEDAAVDAINLAKILNDGEQVIVQSKSDLMQQQTEAPAIDSAVQPQTGSGKININTASSSELQTISGIGQSKAEKIIEYREKSGPFKSIEDLTNISGIGEKTLESIKEYICV